MVGEIKPVRIGDYWVGPSQPVFITAEIGINSSGFLEVFKKIADIAKMAGANAVKFQTRTVETVYAGKLEKPRPVPKVVLEHAIARGVLPDEAVRRLVDSNFENSTEGDQKRALEFTLDEYREIDAYCRSIDIMWFTACWDVESLERMEKNFPDLPCHKIASPCNQDKELMQAVRATGKPIILSTGMSDMDDIRYAVETLGRDNLIILHCRSVYPTGIESGEEVRQLINLRGIDTLREEFGVPVGISSHDSGIMPTYAAVARGAVMIEKHVTLSHTMYGSDQASSIDSIDMIRLCRAVKELDQVLGDGSISIHPEERNVAQKLRRFWRS